MCEIVDASQDQQPQNEYHELYRKLNGILREFEITHICSFDDEWDSPNSPEDMLLRENIEQFIKDRNIILTDEQRNVVDNEGYLTIGELILSNVPEIQSLIEECKSFLQPTREDPSLKVLDQLLNDFNGEGITVTKYQGKVNPEDIKNIAGRILFLLDMNMAKIGGEEDVVISSIMDINRERKNKLDLIVVYSHEKSLECYDTYELKIKYVTEFANKNQDAFIGLDRLDMEAQKYLLPYQLWGIKKTTDEKELIMMLSNLLEKATFGHSLHDYLNAKYINSRKAIIELIKTTEEKFDFLYQDAFVEGEIFLDILERTEKSILRKVEYEEILNNNLRNVFRNVLSVAHRKSGKILEDIKANHNNKLDKYRNRIKNLKISNKKSEDISEHGLIDYSINKSYRSVSAGDIFAIKIYESESIKYGILINPECDLPVRFTKKTPELVSRNSNNLLLYLFEARDLNVPDTATKIFEDRNNEILWPVKNSNVANSYLALFPTKQLLNLDGRLLDLCSLNEDGWAVLNPDENNTKIFKTYQYNIYFENELKLWIQKILDLQEYHHLFPSKEQVAVAMQQPVDEKENIKLDVDRDQQQVTSICINYFDLIVMLAGLKYGIVLNPAEQRFEIQRIGRLETRRTLQLIRNNANHISRIGTDQLPYVNQQPNQG